LGTGSGWVMTHFQATTATQTFIADGLLVSTRHGGATTTAQRDSGVTRTAFKSR
jgi:hypothetical protein